MAEVLPFRGYRYNPEKAAAGDVAAPPYDVIDEERRERLAARSPWNAVHLILPKAGEVAGVSDKYETARVHLQEWREKNILLKDERPALYRYRQDFKVPGVGAEASREGLIAEVRLYEFAEKAILPHEKTLSGPKEDRLRLLEATQTNLSPTFSFYFDPEGKIRGALGQAPAQGLCDFTDEEGVRHRLWAVTDPQTQVTVKKAFGERPLFLADGHHRYTTALHYRNLVRQRTGHSDPQHPAEFMMMFVAEAAEMTVLPYHRMLLAKAAQGVTAAGVLEKLAGQFAARSYSTQDQDGREEFYKDLQEDPAHYAFGLVEKGRAHLLQVKDAAALAGSLGSVPESLRDLDVTALHEFVLHGQLGFDTARIAEGGILKYSPDFGKVFANVDSGEAALGFLLRPTKLEQVRAVAQAGEVMPQKSTYFYPKIGSGLVFRSLEDA